MKKTIYLLCILFLITSAAADFPLVTGPAKTFPLAATESVAACGDRLYMSAGDTLWIYDITDYENPVFLKEVRWAGIAVAGGPQTGQYISCNTQAVVIPRGDNGLTIIDADTYAKTSVLDYASWSSIDGDIAYVVGSGEVKVVDISDPGNPIVAGSIAGSATGILADNNRIFVNRGQSVDIYTADLAKKSTYAFEDTIYDLAVNESLLGVAGYASPVDLVDISDLENPVKLSDYSGDMATVYKKIAFAGNYLIVTKHDCYVDIVDVSDPNSPSFSGRYQYRTDIGGYPRDAQRIDDNTFAFAASYRGASIVSVEPIQQLAKIEGVGRSFGADYHGGIAYSLEDAGLRIIDFALEEPQVISFLYYGARGSKLLVEDGIAYVAASWGGLYIIDVSDPENQDLIYHWNPGEYVYYVEKQGSRLYVTTSAFGETKPYLAIYDISDPGSPQLLGKGHADYELHSISLYGSYAYVSGGRTAAEGTVYVYDISSEENPHVVNSVTGIYPRSTKTSSNMLYVGDYYDGIHAYSLADPAEPLLLGEYTAPYARDPTSGEILVLGEDLLYCSPYDGWVVDLNISDPENMFFKAELDTPAGVSDIKLREGYFVIGCGEEGVSIYPTNVEPISTTTTRATTTTQATTTTTSQSTSSTSSSPASSSTTTTLGGSAGGSSGGGSSGGGSVGGATVLVGCFDGIMNCHEGLCEEQIDCGGPCLPCMSCSDGVQNQGEEGIDCGGPCPECKTGSTTSTTQNMQKASSSSTSSSSPTTSSSLTTTSTSQPIKEKGTIQVGLGIMLGAAIILTALLARQIVKV